MATNPAEEVSPPTRPEMIAQWAGPAAAKVGTNLTRTLLAVRGEHWDLEVPRWFLFLLAFVIIWLAR